MRFVHGPRPAPMWRGDEFTPGMFGARYPGGRDPRELATGTAGFAPMLYVVREPGGIYRSRCGRAVIVETPRRQFAVRVDGEHLGVHPKLTAARVAAAAHLDQEDAA